MEPRTRAGNGTGRGDIIALQLGGHFRVATTRLTIAVTRRVTSDTLVIPSIESDLPLNSVSAYSINAEP